MNDKEKSLTKLAKSDSGRRTPFAGLLALGAVALLLATSCGGLTAKTVAGKDDDSLTIQINAARGTDRDGNPIIRANSRDSIEIVATVRGLSSAVGFYIAGQFGTFPGGTVGADGYTYFNADETGVARAMLVSINDTKGTMAGRAELFVKSRQKTVSQLITFEFATLTLVPATLTFDAGPNTRCANVVAMGAALPITWAVSHPQILSFSTINSTTVKVCVNDFQALTAATLVSLTAFDAEGQLSTTSIKGGSSFCNAAVLTVSPATVTVGTTGAGGSGSTVVSITVDDFDRSQDASVQVLYTGRVNGGGLGTYTLTLTPWVTPGVFQGTFTMSSAVLPTGVSDTDTVQYSDLDAACQSSVVATTVTWTGA